ncbi:MAG: hypothetical protein A2932_01720 [Candidatus Spechtbacteria bacterium RIFCSPLOWO2_01_FULL_46_10]|uniref:Zinc finger DksA/TraR C4-type domain-containing protein n=1 Tax=Candidatus Spechtbacteria bacterium RIFCSPLOWO2_01_FULL_46_10 TaxID=1802163 RepID=A0A1G2HG94_9BACT|nr:MAG: hypothetical protein A2932_01720 [Candidatus Spechtbacteria bacterium RIFCSPLOWO2_01_FULL_46_10]
MTQTNLEKFKKLLEEKKKHLEDGLSAFAQRSEVLEEDWKSKYPGFGQEENVDMERETDEVTEYISRLPVEQALELRLKAVTEALDRMKKRAYGKCSNCKGNIPIKRLEAMPETTICLKCQKKKPSA